MIAKGFELLRGVRGAACACGGYMDRVPPTPEERDEAGRRDLCPCCVAVFACRICQDREVTAYPEPVTVWGETAPRGHGLDSKYPA